MANTIGNAFSNVGSFNKLGSLFGSQSGQKGVSSGFGSAVNDLNQAMASGNKERIQDAASKLKSGESISQSYQASFMEASFTQSGGNFTFQLGVLSMSGTQSAFNNGDSMGTYSRTSTSLQTITITGSMSSLSSLGDILKDKGFDLSAIGYEGKPINELSQDEASSLISDSGFFGIKNTANRVADFVIKGAGDSLDMLKAGLEGVKRGYEEAQKAWGSTLPEISQKTQELTLKLIEERIAQLGGDASGSAMSLEV